MEQMQRYNQRLVEEMKNKQTQERVRLPKIQRSEAKTRMAMYKKSLRITANAAITIEQERERIKQVQTLWTHATTVSQFLLITLKWLKMHFLFLATLCHSGIQSLLVSVQYKHGTLNEPSLCDHKLSI